MTWIHDLPMLPTVDHGVAVGGIKGHDLLATFSSCELGLDNTTQVRTFLFSLRTVSIGPFDHLISVFGKAIFVCAAELDTIVAIVLTRHTLLYRSGPSDTIIYGRKECNGGTLVKLEVSGRSLFMKGRLLECSWAQEISKIF